MGKPPTTSVRRLTDGVDMGDIVVNRCRSSLLSRSSGFVDQIFFPVRDREPGEGEQVGVGVAEHLLDLGQLLAQHRGDDLELLGDVLGIGLGEDRADRGGDHLLVALAHDREDVAHEVDPTPLPGCAEEQHGGVLRNSGLARLRAARNDDVQAGFHRCIEERGRLLSLDPPVLLSVRSDRG